MKADAAVGMLVLDGLLAVACLVIGLHHLGLLLTGRAARVPAAAHALMGFGMAAMFAPALDPLPQVGWFAVFVAVAAWAVAAVVRSRSPKGEPGQLMVGAAAMLFMLLMGHSHAAGPAAALDTAHRHGAAGSAGLLVTVVALGLAGWFLVDIVRLVVGQASVPVGSAGPGAAAVAVAPERRIPVPHLVMSAAMAIMLLGAA